ncbi:MAG: hypothetical protein M0025_12500 [Elusimicrobia bacterium]|nr:hypothetical protein [Elusimicrobiota bacterium]
MKISLRRFAWLLLGLSLFPYHASASGFALEGLSAASLPVSELRVPAPAPAAAAAPLRVYDFRRLYGGLGYPSPDYFGSSAEAVADIETYTSKDDSFYGEINGYLRYYPGEYEWYGTGPEDARKIVARLDTVFANVPSLPRDAVLFRGLRLGWHGNKPFSEGEEYVDKGYVSTSFTLKVAEHFALEMGGEEDDGARKAVLVIYTARPEKGILVDQGEDEAILPHGRRFRVMAFRPGPGYDLYLVQLCPAACAKAASPEAAAFWENFRP